MYYLPINLFIEIFEFMSKETQNKRSPKSNSRTAAKLALQSAANNPNSNTAQHLTRFGQMLMKIQSEEEFNKLNKKSDPEGNEKHPLKSLWSKLATKIFSKKSPADQNKKDDSNENNDIQPNDDSGQRTENLIENDFSANDKVTTPSPKLTKQKPDELSDNKAKKMDTEIVELNERNKADPQEDKIDNFEWKKLCVELRNVGFKYPRSKHKEAQLKDVNVSIPKSAIYGLLGPSGCGKTTLLKIIVGRIRQSSGSAKVNGKKPNSKKSKVPGVGVGYMPQDLALYSEFTIEETLHYYGAIYGMLKNQIHQRILFLVEFLDLPEPTRMVDQLSGGQKRRVSLAAALVHNPPLLILDEPTVGVDPLLRERIWDHLMVLADREKTTILITTHYIDEAKRANIVALMREGTLLIEHSPQFLMKHFKVSNLEDVFLKVCRYGQSGSGYTMPKNYIDVRNSMKKVITKHITGKKSEIVISADVKADGDENKINFNDEDIKRYSPNKKLYATSNAKIMCALISKSFIRLRRNIPLLLFQLALPTIQIILFCICIGKSPFGLTLAVNNQETLSAQTRNDLTFSPLFFHHIDSKTFTLKDYNSMDLAIDSVKDGHSWGALVVKENFTKSLMDRAASTAYILEDSVIDSSTIDYYGDFSDMIISRSIVQELIETQQKFLTDLIELDIKYNASNNSSNPRAVDPLINFVDPPIYGSLRPSFRDFMAPGIIISICYFMATGLTSIAIIIERKEGILDRTLVAGVKPYHIVLNSFMVNFIIVIMQASILLIFAFIVFKITCNGSIILVVALVLMQGIGGIAFGLFISTICDKEETAIMMGLGSFYPMLLLSGILWPLEAMPTTLRFISYFLPHTLPVLSLRNIMLRGWGLAYFAVILGYITTLAWITIFLILAIIIVSFIRK